MKNKSVTTYHVTYEGMGGWFSQDGYSKYNERLTKKYAGTLDGEVYGYEQSLDHIKELKEHTYLGKLAYEGVKFQVEVRTTVSTIINQE